MRRPMAQSRTAGYRCAHAERLAKGGLNLKLDTQTRAAARAGGFCRTVPRHIWRALWKGFARMDVDISQASGPHKGSGALSGGRQHASGTGRADGGAGGDARGGGVAARPRFDAPVAPDGYRWWYIDALSDDGQHGLTIIGFVGSVFSPYYAARPQERAALTLKITAPSMSRSMAAKRRWAMTERGAAARDARHGPASASDRQA